jgi:hypothetical protein
MRHALYGMAIIPMPQLHFTTLKAAASRDSPAGFTPLRASCMSGSWWEEMQMVNWDACMGLATCFKRKEVVKIPACSSRHHPNTRGGGHSTGDGIICPQTPAMSHSHHRLRATVWQVPCLVGPSLVPEKFTHNASSVLCVGCVLPMGTCTPVCALLTHPHVLAHVRSPVETRVLSRTHLPCCFLTLVVRAGAAGLPLNVDRYNDCPAQGVAQNELPCPGQPGDVPLPGKPGTRVLPMPGWSFDPLSLFLSLSSFSSSSTPPLRSASVPPPACVPVRRCLVVRVLCFLIVMYVQ